MISADVLIRDGLPWLLSAITIWKTLLAGKKHRNTWLVGLIGQFGWSVWIIAVGAWGFAPLALTLWVLYLRNHLAWRRA